MLCKNCSNVLFGNEVFCPNCGVKCEKEEAEKKTEDKSEKTSGQKSKHCDADDIFASEPVYVYSKEYDSRKKRKSGQSSLAVTFLVTFILVVLAVGGFVVADYYGLVPAAASFLPTGATKADTTAKLVTVSTTLQSDYSDADGIVPPQTSFKPVLCFVSTEGSLSLRKGPGDSYAQLTALPVGTQVQVIGGSITETAWVYAYVPVEDSYGWLCSSFLSTKDAFDKEMNNEEA